MVLSDLRLLIVGFGETCVSFFRNDSRRTPFLGHRDIKKTSKRFLRFQRFLRFKCSSKADIRFTLSTPPLSLQ